MPKRLQIITIDPAIALRPASQLFEYWAIAFISLCVAAAAIKRLYMLIDTDLAMHGWRQEVVIAGFASMVQGAGFWVSASIFHGRLRLGFSSLIVVIS